MFAIDLSNPVGMRDRAIFGILAYTIMRDGAVGRFDITDYYRSWQAEGGLPREGFDQEGISEKAVELETIISQQRRRRCWNF